MPFGLGIENKVSVRKPLKAYFEGDCGLMFLLWGEPEKKTVKSFLLEIYASRVKMRYASLDNA